MKALLAILFTLALPANLALAHGVSEPSATMTMRGRHVQLELRIDVVRILTGMVPESSRRSIPDLATASESEIDTLLRGACDGLVRAVDLRSGDARVQISNVRWPPAETIQRHARQVMMAQLAGGHAHPALLPVYAEAMLPDHEAAVGLTLPPDWGPVRVTWLEPVSTTAAPGEAAHFTPRAHTPAAGHDVVR